MKMLPADPTVVLETVDDVREYFARFTQIRERASREAAREMALIVSCVVRVLIAEASQNDLSPKSIEVLKLARTKLTAIEERLSVLERPADSRRVLS